MVASIKDSIPAGSDAAPKGEPLMSSLKPILMTVVAVVAGIFIAKKLKLL
jgi:hypothetical protein